MPDRLPNYWDSRQTVPAVAYHCGHCDVDRKLKLCITKLAPVHLLELIRPLFSQRASYSCTSP